MTPQPIDEPGAHIPDALARQQILARLTTEPKPHVEIAHGFPWKRIERLLGELIEAGEVIKELKPVGDGMFGLKRDTWRLAPLPPIEINPMEAPDVPGPVESPKTESQVMAKRTPQVQESQIPLINVEHAMAMPFKALRRKYEAKNSEKNEANKELKEIRFAIIDLIKKNGISPDIDGVIKFEMDRRIIEITPGESKLSIKDKPKAAPKKSASVDDEE